MVNQEIVEIDGKKYVRFNKYEQPNVKAGDVVTYVEDSPHIPKGSQCTVVQVVGAGHAHHEILLWVDCPDGKRRNRYHWRFGVPLVEEDVVVCKSAKGTKLVLGTAYKVKDRKPGYLRVKGFSVWFKESRFVKQGEKAPVQAPAPEIDEDQNNLTELAKYVDKRGVGTASYRVVHQDGEVSDHVGDVCHARIFTNKRYGFSPIKSIYLNFSGHLKQIEKDQHANYANFLDYVVNDSPWKDAFIPRDKAKLIQDGVALNVNRGKNLLVSAAIACRIASEYNRWGFLKEWSLLVEAGCSKNLAMVVASLVAFMRYGYTPGNHHGGHHFFSDNISVKNIMAFFNEGKMKEGEITNTAKDGRYQVFELIGKPTYGDDTLASYIRKNYKLNVKKDLFGEDVVKVERSATWGYAPLAFCLSSIIK